MKCRTLLSALLLAACVSCGGDSDDGVDAGSTVVGCTITATITPDSNAQTMTGLGSVVCDEAATITVETCVQSKPLNSFEDLQCMSSTVSDVTELEVENLSSCGLFSMRSFRTRVLATINGGARPEALSDEVSCL